jgi:heptaprenyl diphosphate synthase/octaprenyl-diphosphate synthase
MAMESGAVLSQAPEESIQLLIEYGHNLGIAFQIVDDILDFTSTEAALGKPVGSDLTQGTLTLPMLNKILNLPEYPSNKRLFIVDMMKKLLDDNDKVIDSIVEAMKEAAKNPRTRNIENFMQERLDAHNKHACRHSTIGT